MRKLTILIVLVIAVVVFCGWYAPVRNMLVPVIASFGETIRLAVVGFGGSPIIQQYGMYIAFIGGIVLTAFGFLFGHATYNRIRRAAARSSYNEAFAGAPSVSPVPIPSNTQSIAPPPTTVSPPPPVPEQPKEQPS